MMEWWPLVWMSNLFVAFCLGLLLSNRERRDHLWSLFPLALPWTLLTIIVFWLLKALDKIDSLEACRQVIGI